MNNNINNLNNQFNNMNINNNMNFGMFIPNNFGFNMMNNNFNNNMFMINNNLNNEMMFNQMNMDMRNNNMMQINNIKEQKININKKYRGELCKGPGQKINCYFTETSGERTTIVANYGTTIHQLLTNYLKLNGMCYLNYYLNKGYIYFLLAQKRLKLSDERAVEKVAKDEIKSW